MSGMGTLLLNILSKYIEGKNEEMSTSKLSGGARNHHFFQDIFVKSLEVARMYALVGMVNSEWEVDPCEDLTDDDIRTAIQKATGPKSALFVPEMSHRCMVNELQRFPILRKRMHELELESFLAKINGLHKYTSCGNKAHEMALLQVKPSRIAAPNLRSRKVPTSERSLKSRAILARSVGGFIPDQVGLSASSSPCLVVRLAPVVEKTIASGSNVGSSWRISSIFEHGPCFLNDPLERGKSDQKRSTQCGSSINFIGIGSGVFIFKFLSTVLAIYRRENLLEEMLQQGSLSFSEKKFKILEELPLDAETVERPLVFIGG
ncbi:hypothetical protein KY289_004647 [Solanum tuberosum]|nr:hypothetical protein KY289_004647 [Solanum tuberosum]